MWLPNNPWAWGLGRHHTPSDKPTASQQASQISPKQFCINSTILMSYLITSLRYISNLDYDHPRSCIFNVYLVLNHVNQLLVPAYNLFLDMTFPTMRG